MQTLFYDFIPVLLFFICFKVYGIYVATVVGIVATGVQVIMTRLSRQQFDKQQLITFGIFVVFGGMTLYFHNPIFIKWKPTIIFWVFAAAFLLSQFIGRKTLIQRMLTHILGNEAEVPTHVWKRLNLAWITFFILLGSVNLYVAYTFSTAVWVNFKVFGILSLLVLFSMLQSIYLSRYLSNLKQ
jgi:intracellular septation protein